MFTRKTETTQVAIIIAFVCAMVFGLYSQSLFHGFVWDDQDFIIDWQTTKSFPDSLGSLLGGDLPQDHKHAYRPIRSIFYAISFKLWGYNSIGYHFQAITVHTITSIFIMLIVYQLSSKNKKMFMTFSGLLFGLHPLATEMAAWITASFDNLGNLFFFGSLFWFIRYRQSEKVRDHRFSLLCAGIAFYTYELTLTLPAILYVYDRFVLKKSFPLKAYTPYLLLQAPYWLLKFGYLDLNPSKPQIYNSLFPTILLVTMLLSRYFLLYLFPWTQNVNHQLRSDLTAFYHHDLNLKAPPAIPSISDIDIIFSIILLLSLGFIAYKARKKFGLITFGLVAFFLTLSPGMQFFPRSIIFSERYLYLGGGLLIISLIVSLNKYTHLNKKLLVSLSLIISSLCALQTYSRINDWKTNISLWQASIADNPISPTLYRNLGDEYYKTHQFKLGEEATRKGLEINPNDPFLRENLIVGLIDSGQFEKALIELEVFREIHPKSDFGYYKAGDIYFVQGKYAQARNFYLQALDTATQFEQYLRTKIKTIDQIVAE